MVELFTRLDIQFHHTMFRNWSPLPFAELVTDVVRQPLIRNNALETTNGEESPLVTPRDDIGVSLRLRVTTRVTLSGILLTDSGSLTICFGLSWRSLGRPPPLLDEVGQTEGKCPTF